MAKRRLYGAALAAYNRKRSRTALVRRGRSLPARRISVSIAGPRKGRRRRRRRGGGAIGGMFGGGTLLGVPRNDLLGAVGYGWLTRSDSPTAAEWRTNYVSKVPVIDAIGAPASHGVLLYFLARNTGGIVRKVANHLSHAALMRTADNFGAANFDTAKFAQMSGEDDEYDGDFSGAMDPEDFVDIEGDEIEGDEAEDDDPGEG